MTGSDHAILTSPENLHLFPSPCVRWHDPAADIAMIRAYFRLFGIKNDGRVAITFGNVICDTPVYNCKNIVLPFFL